MGVGDREVERPEGSTIDLDMVLAVAERTNAAHRTMGTRMVSVQRHSALIELDWRPDLAEVDGGGIGHGALAALLDHGCALAALMSADDEAKAGATIGLRVDHVSPSRPGEPVRVQGRCDGRGSGVAFATARAFHPDNPDELLAAASATVAGGS